MCHLDIDVQSLTNFSKKRESYIFLVISCFPLLHTNLLKQNRHWKKKRNPYTRPCICLEDVTKPFKVPLNLWNPLSTCPFYFHIQETFRNWFILSGSQLVPSPWFSVPFLFSKKQGAFCFLQSPLPTALVPAYPLGQWNLPESWRTQLLIHVGFPTVRAQVTN